MALTRRALPAAWTLRHVGGDSPVAVDGVPATVPGCVHTDLLAAGLIPDPFADTNELAVAWVADADWEYRTAVDLTVVEGHDRAELVFHGLDTLATVSLDGAVVAETENMHRTYRVDVTGRRGRCRRRRPLSLRHPGGGGPAAAGGRLAVVVVRATLQLRAQDGVQLGVGLGTMADHGRHLAGRRAGRLGRRGGSPRSDRWPRSKPTAPVRSPCGSRSTVPDPPT